MPAFDKEVQPPDDQDSAAQVEPDSQKYRDDFEHNQFEPQGTGQGWGKGIGPEYQHEDSEGDRQPGGDALIPEKAHEPCEWRVEKE